MRLLKLCLIIFLILLGAYFLAAGLGGNIPMLEYGDAKAYGLPIGAAFLIVAVLIAAFWKISSKTKRTTERTITRGDTKITIKETVDTDEVAY